MNNNQPTFNFAPVRDYDFSQWFKSVDYNGKTVSFEERMKLVSFINENISLYSSGLPIMQDCIEGSKGLDDEFHIIEYKVSSIFLFILLSSIDIFVISKYFLLADNDYDRRFMRGKMMVILNEGFKKLYGFEKETKKKSEWSRLKPYLTHFPTEIQNQYHQLTEALETLSKSSSWWREERNLETHLDAEGLYKSRQEEVIESKVMMDSLKLFNTLHEVNLFMTNVHACLHNFLVEKYNRGELKEC